MSPFSFFKTLLLHINLLFLQLSHSYLDLDIGLTSDDYTTDWNNGDYLIDNSSISTELIYHGPFDEYTTILSRQIRVQNYGYIRINFTLIFACDILNFTDNVILQFDTNTQASKYYWIDTYSYDYSSNKYPYTTSNGFIIEEYYDSILLDSYCTNNINGIGNTISWAIHDSYLSEKAYKSDDIFLISFHGKFNHNSPYNNDGKYWAVTNIKFELQKMDIKNENMNKRKPNYSVLIILIVMFVIMVIVIIVMTIKKKRKERLSTIGSIAENNIEMSDKQIVSDKGGLLINDAIKENKEKEKKNDELIVDHKHDQTEP